MCAKSNCIVVLMPWIPCMAALLQTPNGFTALPFAVTLPEPLEDMS